MRFNNRVVMLLCVTVLSMCLAEVSEASIFSNALNGGGVTRLEDSDFESVIGGNGNNIIEVGEFLVAIADFDTFEDANSNTTLASFDNTTRSATAVSLIKVASKVANPFFAPGVGYNYTFSAPTAADWLAHTGLAGVLPGTLLVAYDDPIPVGSDNHIVNTSIAAGITSASEGGAPQYQFGFTGAPGEFWIAGSEDTSLTGGIAGDDISQITDLDFLASLNVIDKHASAPELAPHNHLAAAFPSQLGAIFTDPADLQLQGALGTVSQGGFDASTDTDAYILAVPEPTAFIVWGLLASVAGGLTHRRKKS